MSNKKIALLTLFWTIICGLTALYWVIMPIFIKYVKPRLQQWHYTKLVPSQRGARRLRRLAKTVGQIIFWLSYSENEMMRSIGRELFKVERKIITESSVYLAIHSDNNKERWSSLLFLSQVDEEFIDYARDTVNRVEQELGNSDKIRNVAKAALEELNKRRKIINKEGEQ